MVIVFSCRTWVVVVAAEVVVDVVFEQPARDMLTKAAAKRKANKPLKIFSLIHILLEY